MSSSAFFRHRLAHRILALIAVAIPAAPGCTSRSVSSTDDCHPEPIEGEVCFAPPYGSKVDGSVSPAACPSRDDAKGKLTAATGAEINDVKSDAIVKDDECCYDVVRTPICEGRPYLVNDVPRTAGPVRGLPGWSVSRTNAQEPRTSDLARSLRDELAAQWTRDGLFEHASVASFGRFALELLAAGAPDDLVEAAHRAALDEVRHARLCFALASAYAQETIAPGPFPFEGHVQVTSDLASIAARAAKEGCIGETIAAAVAAEQLGSATDPAVREVLSTIAEDEARHSELAWRVVAWAIRTGGVSVAKAVANVFAKVPTIEISEDCTELAEHGRLGSEQLRATARRALEEVVHPAARALLAAAGFVAAPSSTRKPIALQ
ncbi:MAG: putative secreted protein [Labilithrix sp.]|nr:putative secreted protein [Labilithrix sp.]